MAGRSVDAVLVHLRRARSGTASTAIEDFKTAETPEEQDAALEFLIPEWKSGTFQVGFTSDSGWDTAFIVRNVFDDAGYTYLSSTDYGEVFGDPRFRHIRNLQRPRQLLPVVHQEVVTPPA